MTTETTTAFSGLPDLACSTMGGKALWASDNFFAGVENLVRPEEPAFDPDAYTERGKLMDGWEPRRRRHPGHDTAIVQLGTACTPVGVDIDTRHFLGNHAPYASLEATVAPAGTTGPWLRDNAEWTVVLDQVRLERGGHNLFALKALDGATHVRLHIYPAGGVARLRVYGTPRSDGIGHHERQDLLCASRGGKALACSDMFFSRMDNLIRPDEAVNMGDGWETKRNPVPKEDHVILALGQAGLLDDILVHTRHFKGNYPTGVRIEALHWPKAPPHALRRSTAWTAITADSPLGPHRGHTLPVTDPGPWTHLKMTILSDGGISRLRAFGTPAETTPADGDRALRWLNRASVGDATAALSRCCGARRWVQQMVAARPFASRTHLHGHADHAWWHLGDGDWLEAFTHHPRIGASAAALRERFGETADWASGEQSSVAAASEATIAALAAANTAYDDRYGYIFIVCASGLSASQMLDKLNARMHNSADDELRIAAGEQARITALRLNKLLDEHSAPTDRGDA